MRETTSALSQISRPIAEVMDHKPHLRCTALGSTSLAATTVREIGEYATQITVMAGENTFRFGLVVAQHHECGHLDIPLSLLEGGSSVRLAAAGDASNHRLCTALQLRVRRLHVDHHAAIDAAEAQHDAGRDQVEHDLLR